MFLFKLIECHIYVCAILYASCTIVQICSDRIRYNNNEIGVNVFNIRTED